MVFWTPWQIEPGVDLPMIFWPRVQFSIWYFDPGVNFLSLYFEPPHGKLNPPPHFYQKRGVHNTIRESFIYHRSKYNGLGGWYTMGRGVDIPWVGGSIYHGAHGISTPLPMVYQTLFYGIMNSSFGRNEGGFNLPWGGSKYNDKKLTPGSKYHMKNWTRGQNIIGKSTPGSICHGVQNTIWHRYWFFWTYYILVFWLFTYWFLDFLHTSNFDFFHTGNFDFLHTGHQYVKSQNYQYVKSQNY
jgi:hypothetical protein